MNLLVTANRLSARSETDTSSKIDATASDMATEKIKHAKRKLSAEFKKSIQQVFDPIGNDLDSDEKKQKYIKYLLGKLNRGEELTAKEMAFLRKNAPVVYQRALRIQRKRESLEQRLKNCDSKQEAEEVFQDTMCMVSENTYDRDAIIEAYKNVWEEFSESAKYKELPYEKKKDDEDKDREKHESLGVFLVTREKMVHASAQYDLSYEVDLQWMNETA